MESISFNDKRLIKDLCDYEIDITEFINKTDFKASFVQLNLLLDETKMRVSEYGDNQYFYSIFWNLPNSLSFDEEVNLYSKYLLKNWHHEHEEIVGSFQAFFHNSKENIPILLKAINNIPDYLRPDDFKYPYIRKIIYAIGVQPEPYNIEALEKLANETNDEQIKELALHQIKKRKKLGRWEATKNPQ